MKGQTFRNSFIAVAIVSITLFTAAGCKKNKKPKAIITVNNSEGSNVGVNVEIHSRDIPSPGVPGVVQKTGKTSSDGKVEFELDNDAILTCVAWTTSGTDTIKGTGTVRFVTNEVTEETITIRKIQ